MLLFVVLKDYLDYSVTDEEKVFLENFIDSFTDCNYENCAYLLRDYLKSCDCWTSIVVHYDWERELFYDEKRYKEKR